MSSYSHRDAQLFEESRIALEQAMQRYVYQVWKHPPNTSQELLDIFDLCGVNMDHLGIFLDLVAIDKNWYYLTRLKKVDRLMQYVQTHMSKPT